MGSSARSGAEIGGEPYQRGFHIVKQASPGPGPHARAGDQHIVTPGPAMKGDQAPRRFPQTTFGAIALHRSADSTGGGEADTNHARPVNAIQTLGEHRATRTRSAFGRGQELRPLAEALDGERGPGRRGVRQVGGTLVGQAVRRLRPRTRRRATILRPFLVAMRERNP